MVWVSWLISFHVICCIYLFIYLLQAVRIFRATGSVVMLPWAIDVDIIMYIAGKPVMHVCTQIYKLYENLQEDQISSLALFLARRSVCTIPYCALGRLEKSIRWSIKTFSHFAYPIGDDPLSRSARLSFAPRRNHAKINKPGPYPIWCLCCV